jgi:hypothetical protein
VAASSPAIAALAGMRTAAAGAMILAHAIKHLRLRHRTAVIRAPRALVNLAGHL